MARETEKPSDNEKRKAQEERALATEKDRQVRLRSVANDTRLQLPVNIAMPDGEEFPGTQLQIRCYDQRSEIQKCYIHGPPNKTICDSSEWSDVRSSREGKSSSKSQLWAGLKLSSSGKSPPSLGRPRDHQRHTHSANTKNSSSSSSSKHKNSGSSSSSSTGSSTSSSTSSCTGLGVVLAPKSTASGQSFSEKLHTVISEKLYQVGDGVLSSRTNNNSSGTGVLSRFMDETKFRTRSNSKGGSERLSKKQQQQQQQISRVMGNPNGGSGAKLTSVTTTTTTLTRTSTTTTMLKCDASVMQPSENSTLLHQSETFSERMKGGSFVLGTGSSSSSKCMSNSDNNGNSGVSPPPCLMLGASSATPAACVSMPKTDDSKTKDWNRFAEGRRLGEIDSFSQTSVQNVSELIPRTTLFSSAMDLVDCQHQHQHQPLHPTPGKDSSSTSSPHFISQHQPDQYSLVSVDVELLDQRH